LTHPHISIVAAQAQYLVQSLPQLSASGAPKERALMVFLSFDRKSLVKGLTISLVGDGKRLEWRWGKGETCGKTHGQKRIPYWYLKTERWKKTVYRGFVDDLPMTPFP
jgi:hypothetical protein